MAQGHRTDAAFRLRGLARIVDDEGIDHRHRPQQRRGPAVARQRHRLARQPFQRAMRAHVDQRPRALLRQPQVEGDIAMARHAGQVVIAVLAPRAVAAFGLQRQDHRAVQAGAQVEGAVPAIGIGLGRPPGCVQIVPQRLRQAGQGRAVFVQRPGDGAVGQGGQVRAQHRPHRLRGCRRVQPHGMGLLPVAPRIGRQHHRHAPRPLRQRLPGGDAVDGALQHRRIGPVHEARILQVRVARADRLEADEAREDAAVHLGQDHVHRQVRGRQAAFRPGPVPAAVGGQRHLKDRAGKGGEGRLGSGREGGGVHHQGGRLRQRVPQPWA